MFKKDDKKILLIPLLVVFQSSLYFLCKLGPFKPNLIGSSWDLKLPFIPVFIYFYVSWYLLLFLIPYIFYKNDRESFYKYATCSIICTVIASIIFIFYPTTILRNDIEVTGITSFIINFIYKADTPILNCFPSMHCVLCFLFMFNIPKNINKIYKVFIWFISLMIILSTLFVKQHVIIDVVSAFVICLIVYLVVNNKKLYLKIFKS